MHISFILNSIMYNICFVRRKVIHKYDKNKYYIIYPLC
nr:MAG TPA: hypothetical protein [Caudoviricetes sp.]